VVAPPAEGDESHGPGPAVTVILYPKTHDMKANMGSVDRLVRLLAAVLLTTLYLSGVLTGALGVVALVVAGVFLLTSLVRFCPLYTLLGINTCGTKKA